MRSASVATVIVLAAIGSVSHGAAGRSTQAPMVVPCDHIIGSQTSPGLDMGQRVVLGDVSVPRGFIPDNTDLHETPWRYWRKAPMIVRAGRGPVTITVPSAWRRKAAITWGNRPGAVSTVRITACPASPNAWNAYAGGFFTRARSACVPLTIRIGGRSRTVRFGIARHCSTHR